MERSSIRLFFDRELYSKNICSPRYPERTEERKNSRSRDWPARELKRPNSFSAKIGKIEEGEGLGARFPRFDRSVENRVYFERRLRTSPDFFSISVNPRYPRHPRHVGVKNTSQPNLDRSSDSLFHSLVRWTRAKIRPMFLQTRPGN